MHQPCQINAPAFLKVPSGVHRNSSVFTPKLRLFPGARKLRLLRRRVVDPLALGPATFAVRLNTAASNYPRLPLGLVENKGQSGGELRPAQRDKSVASRSIITLRSGSLSRSLMT